NLSGLAQSFKGTVAPRGQARPGWKVLRVMANAMQLPGFDDDTSETVRDAALGIIAERLDNAISANPGRAEAADAQGLERIAEMPSYRSDAIARRAPALQAAPASRPAQARMNAATLSRLGLEDGLAVRVSSASGAVELQAMLDNTVADGAVRVAAGHDNTAALGSAFGNLTVERV